MILDWVVILLSVVVVVVLKVCVVLVFFVRLSVCLCMFLRSLIMWLLEKFFVSFVFLFLWMVVNRLLICVIIVWFLLEIW